MTRKRQAREVIDALTEFRQGDAVSCYDEGHERLMGSFHCYSVLDADNCVVLADGYYLVQFIKDVHRV